MIFLGLAVILLNINNGYCTCTGYTTGTSASNQTYDGICPITDVFLCQYTDSECITSGINSNYVTILNSGPETGITELANLSIPFTEAGNPSLLYQLTNTVISGLENCTFQNVTSNQNKLIYQLNFYCPSLQFTGQYILNGYILNLPVVGQGKFSIVAKNYRIVQENFHGEYSQCNGTYILQIVNSIFVIVNVDSLTYNFQNLRSTNPFLPYNPNAYMNQNSQRVSFLVPDPLWFSILSTIIANYNVLLSSVYTQSYNFIN